MYERKSLNKDFINNLDRARKNRNISAYALIFNLFLHEFVICQLNGIKKSN